MEVSGTPIARADLRLDREASRLVASLSIEAVGLAVLFGDTSTELAAVAALRPDGQPKPERFDARISKPDRERRVEITYGPAGRIASAKYRQDGKAREIEPPADLWVDAVDPLTALLRAQQWLVRAVSENTPDEFRAVVFNGRKVGVLALAWNGETTDPLAVTARIENLFGLDRSDPYVWFPDNGRTLLISVDRTTMLPIEVVSGDETFRVTAID